MVAAGPPAAGGGGAMPKPLGSLGIRGARMSFRGRLRVFFTIIVIVPMVAVALVLFTLTAESETGKADAGIAAALRNAFTLYDQASDRAEPVLRRVGNDDALRTALA